MIYAAALEMRDLDIVTKRKTKHVLTGNWFKVHIALALQI